MESDFDARRTFDVDLKAHTAIYSCSPLYYLVRADKRGRSRDGWETIAAGETSCDELPEVQGAVVGVLPMQ